MAQKLWFWPILQISSKNARCDVVVIVDVDVVGYVVVVEECGGGWDTAERRGLPWQRPGGRGGRPHQGLGRQEETFLWR